MGEIEKLPAPITVKTMIGDAGVGKSLTWNTLNYIWTGKNRSSVEQVFQTGDSLARVTRGVWAYVTQRENGTDILLEVETGDLFDKILVAHIYMFAATISSGLIVLTRDYVKDSDLQPLNHMARVNEYAFPSTNCNNFPAVSFVVRGDFGRKRAGGSGDSTRSSVLERFTSKCFPRSKVTVSQISHVIDREVFTDFGKLSQSNFMISMENLAAKVENFPIKRNLEGIPMEGDEITKLIERLAETIDADSWLDLADVYKNIEIRKRITEKDREIEVEREKRQIADQEKQVLRTKVAVYEQLLKDEIKRGVWLRALREVITGDNPGGAELLYSQKVLDELKNFREELKQNTDCGRDAHTPIGQTSLHPAQMLNTKLSRRDIPFNSASDFSFLLSV
ncbi:hypothetical protein AWC38_SpisGene13221 [Stylophora pistillata]|uniref:Uncharacterized protein n=1 Tax=Stylophora pistillata TaxID=50429 RepID=A0A2B4S0E0_STYPI|nr:hypothetical protein AWC38_SpisGene13221 [Stylophora pistillata]